MQRAGRAGFPSFGAAFGGFGGLGGSDGLVSSFFGGRDLFDDPFFSQAAGGVIDTHMFGSSIFGSGMTIFGPSMFGMETLFGEPNNDGFFLGPHTPSTRSRGPIIEELPSEDERDEDRDIHTNEQHALPAISQGPLIDERDEDRDIHTNEQHALPATSQGPLIDERDEDRDIHTNEQHALPAISQGPLIEEMSSDDEGEGGDMHSKENPRKHSRPGEDHGGEIEEAVDYAKKMGKRIKYGNSSSVAGIAPPQERAYSFHSSTVTYGGANGAYYTSSTTRTGGNGVIVEESKEADITSGRATHRISRGIHEKGHSLTRKLNNGRVETMQTLHNLNQDELPGFEEAWKGNARQHLPGWNQNQNVNMTYNGINRNGSVAQLEEPAARLLTNPCSEQQQQQQQMVRKGR